MTTKKKPLKNAKPSVRQKPIIFEMSREEALQLRVNLGGQTEEDSRKMHQLFKTNLPFNEQLLYQVYDRLDDLLDQK